MIVAAGYPNQQIMLDAVAASGAELVTVAIRRISLDGYAGCLVDLLGDRYVLLPNTAGCETKRDAVLTAQLAREALETDRSEEHTSELQSLMRISYAVFCLKKKIADCTLCRPDAHTPAARYSHYECTRQSQNQNATS